VQFEPLTLLSALAMVTKNIGLVATASTTYNEPYHVARKFASLDHISGGRAGWNVVTSVTDMEARNFNRDAAPASDARYDRGRRIRRRGSRTLGQLGGRRLHPRQGIRDQLRPN
jgi:alkanesulfonate monooxygenase